MAVFRQGSAAFVAEMLPAWHERTQAHYNASVLISRNEARGILMARRNRFNPKRRICEAADPSDLEGIAGRVRDVGNPEHKRNPGDFGLTPPAQPRADKTLCDD